MEIIKQIIKKYPFMFMIVSMLTLSVYGALMIGALVAFIFHNLLSVIILNYNYELSVFVYFMTVLVWTFLSLFSVTIIFNCILKQANSGLTYLFIKKLHDSIIVKILFTFILISVFYFIFNYDKNSIFTFHIVPYIILFLYWYITDIMIKSNSADLTNFFEKTIYHILNKTKNIWVNSVLSMNKLKTKMSELGFIKKSKTFILTKAQMPTFICVNILCSGYLINYILYLLGHKIRKIYFGESIDFLDNNCLYFEILFIIAIVYFFIRFMILPKTYDAIIESSDSGIIRDFLLKLKENNSLKILTLIFVFVVDIFLTKYLYHTTMDIVNLIFWGYTPIYLILYYHWNIKRK